MWIVSSLQLVPTTMDFRSSGLGVGHGLSLQADGITLSNLLRLVEWDADPVQLELCEECGTTGCSSGGYVAIRRLGAYVTLMPSARGCLAPDASERSEYFEPVWMRRKRGVPLIAASAWERLREEGAPLPPAESFRPLAWDEAFLAAQLEAPYQLLGELGAARTEPLSRRVVATDPWLEPEVLDRLGTAAEWTRHPGHPLLTKEAPRPISLVLDAPLATVDLFVQGDTGPGLFFAPGLALFPEAHD